MLYFSISGARKTDEKSQKPCTSKTPFHVSTEVLPSFHWEPSSAFWWQTWPYQSPGKAGRKDVVLRSRSERGDGVASTIVAPTCRSFDLSFLQSSNRSIIQYVITTIKQSIISVLDSGRVKHFTLQKIFPPVFSVYLLSFNNISGLYCNGAGKRVYGKWKSVFFKVTTN